LWLDKILKLLVSEFFLLLRRVFAVIHARGDRTVCILQVRDSLREIVRAVFEDSLGSTAADEFEIGWWLAVGLSNVEDAVHPLLYPQEFKLHNSILIA
jgi:hypothetical protein